MKNCEVKRLIGDLPYRTKFNLLIATENVVKKNGGKNA